LFGDDDEDEPVANEQDKEQQEKKTMTSLFGDDDDDQEEAEDGNLFGSDDEPEPAPAPPPVPKRRSNFDIMMDFYGEVAPDKANAEGITKALTVFKDTLPKMCDILTKKYGRAPVLNMPGDEEPAAPAPAPSLFENNDDDDDDDDDDGDDNENALKAWTDSFNNFLKSDKDDEGTICYEEWETLLDFWQRKEAIRDLIVSGEPGASVQPMGVARRRSMME